MEARNVCALKGNQNYVNYFIIFRLLCVDNIDKTKILKYIILTYCECRVAAAAQLPLTRIWTHLKLTN